MLPPDFLTQLRTGARERNRTRPRGPELAAVDDLAGPGGLRLRRYRPYAAGAAGGGGADAPGGSGAGGGSAAGADEPGRGPGRRRGAGVPVRQRREPGLPHGFVQGMDLTDPAAAAAHERLFADLRDLVPRAPVLPAG